VVSRHGDREEYNILFPVTLSIYRKLTIIFPEGKIKEELGKRKNDFMEKNPALAGILGEIIEALDKDDKDT
jgi:hypothetical protein